MFHIHYKRTRYSFKTKVGQAAFKQGLYAAIEADTVRDYLMTAQYDDCKASDKCKQEVKLS